MDFKKNVSLVLDEITKVMNCLNLQDIEHFIQDIVGANRVFLAGSGRVLLQLKCFAKRLSQTEIDAYVIGETTTPPVAPGDILIVSSCSGKTIIPLAVATQARMLGARLWGITTCTKSPVADCCDRLLNISCTGYRQNNAEIESSQPMNNLFEQILHLLFDIINWEAQKIKGLSDEKLRRNHANIEYSIMTCYSSMKSFYGYYCRH